MRGQQSRFLSPARGFTLIELLTVVAIIAILAGILAVGAPKALEKARVTKVETDFANIRTALTTYYADHGTYPPGYGFPERTWLKTTLDKGDKPELPSTAGDTVTRFYIQPFMMYLNLYEKTDLYDRFSTTYDTDMDNTLGLMEYQPIADLDSETKKPLPIIETLYDAPQDLNSMMTQHSEYGATRPFVYVPVNLAQFKVIEKYWDKNDIMAETMPPNWYTDPAYKSLKNPPPRYDAYVLVSVGPSGNTGGVVEPPERVLELGVERTEKPVRGPLLNAIGNPVYYYPILALRTYYLATRDVNNDGQPDKIPDFDWTARTKQNQAQVSSNLQPNSAEWYAAAKFRVLPDRSLGAGPMIYNPGQ